MKQGANSTAKYRPYKMAIVVLSVAPKYNPQSNERERVREDCGETVEGINGLRELRMDQQERWKVARRTLAVGLTGGW